MRDARNCSRLQVRCVANEWSFMQMNKDEFHSQASTDHNVSHAFILGQFKGIGVTYIHFSRTRMLWTVCLFPHLMYVWFWMEMGDQIRIVNHRDPESMEKERHIDSWPWQSILMQMKYLLIIIIMKCEWIQIINDIPYHTRSSSSSTLDRQCLLRILLSYTLPLALTRRPRQWKSETMLKKNWGEMCRPLSFHNNVKRRKKREYHNDFFFFLTR